MKKSLVVFLAAAVFCAASSRADEKSARFYLNPDATRYGTAFMILMENESIQDELKLTQDVRKKLTLFSPGMEETQSLQKLTAEFTEKSRLAGSDEERSQLLSDLKQKRKEIMCRFKEKTINDFLSADQKARVKQLIYQFHGLAGLADKNTELEQANLLPGQRHRAADLKKAHLSAVDSLMPGIKRNLMGEKFRDETNKMRIERIDSMLDYMVLTGKVMDRVIEGMLTKQQIEKWIELKGKAVPVIWDYKKMIFAN